MAQTVYVATLEYCGTVLQTVGVFLTEEESDAAGKEARRLHLKDHAISHENQLRHYTEPFVVGEMHRSERELMWVIDNFNDGHKEIYRHEDLALKRLKHIAKDGTHKVDCYVVAVIDQIACSKGEFKEC